MYHTQDYFCCKSFDGMRENSDGNKDIMTVIDVIDNFPRDQHPCVPTMKQVTSVRIVSPRSS